MGTRGRGWDQSGVPGWGGVRGWPESRPTPGCPSDRDPEQGLCCPDVVHEVDPIRPVLQTYTVSVVCP